MLSTVTKSAVVHLQCNLLNILTLEHRTTVIQLCSICTGVTYVLGIVAIYINSYIITLQYYLTPLIVCKSIAIQKGIKASIINIDFQLEFQCSYNICTAATLQHIYALFFLSIHSSFKINSSRNIFILFINTKTAVTYPAPHAVFSMDSCGESVKQKKKLLQIATYFITI